VHASALPEREDAVLPSARVIEREEKLSLLLDLAGLLAREVELDAILDAIGRRVADAMRAERATVFLLDAQTGELRSRVSNRLELDEIRVPPGQGIAGFVAERGEVVNLRDAADDPRHFSAVDRATGFTTRTLLAAPLRDPRGATRGVLQVLNKRDGAFDGDDEHFLLALGAQVAHALERTTLRPDARAPRGVSVRGEFNHIVGASRPMRRVYDLVSRAAGAEVTVLLRGETGTGKGLFARAVHANSARAEGPFVTIDCTTLPESLAESELFGHERGAFTGADRRTPGRVELAAGGTLFLDEIGELSAAVQAKLLRLLQERAFERVGGREVLRADVRVVAATHRDLESLVARGLFREDLLYRLRVVEIALPPLRERGADELLSLAEHFLALFARRHGRTARALSRAAREVITAHRWPGNVRELEHALERAVVLGEGDEVRVEDLDLRAGGPAREGDALSLPYGLTLDEVQRRYAAAAVTRADGNQSEAARSLGVSRNTLRRKVLREV
jgi:Nif-specific regulatory protein